MAIVAVTVGASAAVGTILLSVTVARAPFPAGDRLHVLSAGGPSWSPAMLSAFDATNTVFDLVAGVAERSVTLTGSGRPAILRLEGVSASYFALLGIGTEAGRVWTAAEERDGARAFVVISRRLATRLFDSPSGAVGQRIELDGVPLQVGGVVDAGNHGLIGRTDLWLPLRFSRTLGLAPEAPERPWSRWFEVIARVPADLDLPRASARFDTELRRAMATLPNVDTALGQRWRPSMVPLRDRLGDPVLKPSATLLAAGTALVLFLAAANLSVLQLLDVSRRQREFSIRLAIGASPRRLVSDVAGEAVLLAAVGSVAGLLLCGWVIDLLKQAAPMPAGTFGLRSAAILSSTATVSDITSVLLAMIPAAITTMALALPAAWAVHSQTQTMKKTLVPAGRPRGTAVLVTLELALAVTLVAGAGQLAMSARNLWTQDRGFDPRDVTIVSLELPARRYDDGTMALLYRQLTERVATIPGVEVASVTNCVPGSGRCRRTNIARVDGQPLEPHASPTVGVNYVTERHFDLLRIPLVGGRRFDGREWNGPNVVIVSETAARRLWPGQDPLGRRLALHFASGANTEDREVVGVVRDIAFDRTEIDRKPDIYLPSAQMTWSSAELFLRHTAGTRVTTTAIEAALTSVDPDIAVSEASTLETRIGRGFQIELLLSKALLIFATGALLLTVTGVYVVLSHLVTSARREIGIRVALGAAPGVLAQWIVKRFTWTLTLGSVAGVIGASTTGSLFSTLLFNVRPSDPVFVMSAAALVLVTAALSMVPPLRDALSTEPARVLQAVDG